MKNPCFEIHVDSKIYVMSPPGFQTGGTEALHVLAYELRNKGFNAFMYYPYRGGYDDPVGTRFKRFCVPYVGEVEDVPNNVIVVPEAFPEFLRIYRKIQKGFWWLSVDNCWRWFREYRPFVDWPVLHAFEAVRWLILKKRYDFRLLMGNSIDYLDASVIHLAQSYYAYDYFSRRGAVNRAYLMDYLGEAFAKSPEEDGRREDVVLYNPKKGIEFTQKIISAVPNVRFQPLIGMSPEEVSGWCRRAKVYIDFGDHPGKDRFPREAVMQGVAVITGRNGSAKFHEDVPIPEKYKFDRDVGNIPQIVERILDLFQNYEMLRADFDDYRAFVADDKKRFLKQIDDLFVRKS